MEQEDSLEENGIAPTPPITNSPITIEPLPPSPVTSSSEETTHNEEIVGESNEITNTSSIDHQTEPPCTSPGLNTSMDSESPTQRDTALSINDQTEVLPTSPGPTIMQDSTEPTSTSPVDHQTEPFSASPGTTTMQNSMPTATSPIDHETEPFSASPGSTITQNSSQPTNSSPVDYQAEPFSASPGSTIMQDSMEPTATSPVDHHTETFTASPGTTNSFDSDLDALDPCYVQVEGLPYKRRSLESLQQLSKRWEAGDRSCPHPYCSAKPTSYNFLFCHWYNTHMAHGFCRRYQCFPCKASTGKRYVFKQRVNFHRHLRYNHAVDPQQADAIINVQEYKWQKLVNDECMLPEPMSGDTEVRPENRLFLEPESEAVGDQQSNATQSKPVTNNGWGDMHFKNLTIQWKKMHYRCPHPECLQHADSEEYLSIQSFMKHWRETHYADLAGERLACEFCPVTVCKPILLLTHFMDAHDLPHGVAASLVQVSIERKGRPRVGSRPNRAGSGEVSAAVSTPGSPNLSSQSSSQSSTESTNDLQSETQPESRRKRPAEDDPNYLSDDATLNLRIPAERLEVAGLPWKSFNSTKSAALEKAWFQTAKSCPHPTCGKFINSKKTLFQHWHQTHFLPDCGIPYKCYGSKPDSPKPCTEVFDNKWDLIDHARNYHRYPDAIINVLLAKIKDARETGKIQEHLPNTSSKPPLKRPRISSLPAGAMRPSRPSEEVPRLEPLAIKVAPEKSQSSRKSRGLNSIVEQLYQKMSPTVHGTIAEGFESTVAFAPGQREHSENDFVLDLSGSKTVGGGHKPLPLTQSLFSNNNQTQPQTDDQSFSHGGKVTGMKLFHSVRENPIVIEPTPNSDNIKPPGISLLLDLDSELPKAMWRVILNTWRYNLRCPNPECEQKPVQYFSYPSILAHWLGVHIKARQRSRLFACRHGLEGQEGAGPGSEPCHHVFPLPLGLYNHGMSQHGYNSTQAAKAITVANQEWAAFEKEHRKSRKHRDSV